MNQGKNLAMENQNKQQWSQQSKYSIQNILDDNNLVRKQMEEQKNSLMSAVSFGLYYTTQHADTIQKQCKEHLQQLIGSKKLPLKLNSFIQTKKLLQDYLNNPTMSGFEKENLELISLIFKVKILVYYITEEYYLNCMIINNKFDKSIQLLRTGANLNHYDLIFTKSQFQNVDVPQQILQEILQDKLQISIKPNTYDANNAEYESLASGRLHSNSIISQDENQQINSSQPRNSFTRNRHKKSLSETNLTALDLQKPYSLFQQGSGGMNNDLYKIFMGDNQNNSANKSSEQLTPLRNDLLKVIEDDKESAQKNKQQKDLDGDDGDEVVDADQNQLQKEEDKQDDSGEQNQKSKRNRKDSNSSKDSRDIIESQVRKNTEIMKQQQLQQLSQQQLSDYSSYDPNAQKTIDNIISPDFKPSQNPLDNFNKINLNGGNNNNKPQTRSSYLAQPQFRSEQNLAGNLYSNIYPVQQQQSTFNNYNNNLPNNTNNNTNGFVSHLSSHNLDRQPFEQSPPFNPFPVQADQIQNINLFNTSKQMNPGLQNNKNFLGQPQQQQPIPSPYRGNSPKKTSQQSGEQNGQMSTQTYTGRLKFFDENKNYGFLVMDQDNSDIFVHFDDLEKASITKELLKQSKQGKSIRFSFRCFEYIGKHNRSRKAVELQFLPEGGPMQQPGQQQQSNFIMQPSLNDQQSLNFNNPQNTNFNYDLTQQQQQLHLQQQQQLQQQQNNMSQFMMQNFIQQ